ncbi:hypothetical protein [Streptomyces sp. DSM 118878]
MKRTNVYADPAGLAITKEAAKRRCMGPIAPSARAGCADTAADAVRRETRAGTAA